MTVGRLAQKQPSFKECVTAHRRRVSAPKTNEAKYSAEDEDSLVLLLRFGRGAFQLR